MQCEITIHEIMENNISVETMADNICKFMDWDRDELIESINKNGCRTNESRNKIIDGFWRKFRK